MIPLLIAFTVWANMLRHGVGAAPVVPSLPLSQVAQDRADYLCTHPFSHEGFQMFFLARRHYPSHWQAENLAGAFATDEALQHALEQSPEHRKNLLDLRAQELGFGRACGITVLLLD